MNTTSAVPVDARVLDILDEYLTERLAGRTPDRDALLARHPDLAESLAASFRALDFVHDTGRTLAAPAAAPGRREPAGEGRELGDYRILREIARGGMAVVYEAEQVSLGRRVALKVLPFASVLDSKQLQRFQNEAHAAAQIHHPHIVPVFAVGCDRGVHYYAMQYIEGQSLAVAIKELKEGGGATGPKTPISSHDSHRAPAYIRMAATLGVQAAQALEHAHQMGIVHRDVKPGNLLVDQAGTLWVTDFGLAHSRKDVGLTMTGELLGTIRYMSPEQALAKRAPIDHRSDVYSLGATLYELLTLEPAFPGDDPVQVLKHIASKEPVPLRRLNPALPSDVETVLLKAMSKDPAGRYATAHDMAEDLQRFLENRPIHAKRPGLVRRAAKWSQRHRTLVGASAGVLLLAMAGLATGTALLWREQKQTQAAFGRADTNLTRALKAVDEFFFDEAEGHLHVREGLRSELLKKGLGFYEEFAAENAHNKDIAWQVGSAYLRASLIFRQLDQEDQAEKALDKAISACREATRLQPRLVKAHVSLGNALWMKDDLDGAIREYSAAIRLQPDYAGAHTNLGIAFVQHGELGRAIDEFNEAIRLMPDDANAHNELGMALRQKDDLDGAIREFNKAIELQRDLAPAHTNLGHALRDKRDFQGAIRAYETACGLEPESATACIDLGNAFRDNGELAGAIREYRRAIDLQESSYLAHFYLGCALGETGDPAGKIKAIAKAIELRSSDPLLHLMVPHQLEGSGGLKFRAPKQPGGPVLAADGTPIKLDFEGATTTMGDISNEGTSPGSPRMHPVIQVKGTGTPLGEFNLDMRLSVNLPESAGEGPFTFVMANGDTLVGTIKGNFLRPDNKKKPTVVLIVETGTITGGTGRFDGATGGFTIKRLFDRESLETTGNIEGTVSTRRDDGRR